MSGAFDPEVIMRGLAVGTFEYLAHERPVSVIEAIQDGARRAVVDLLSSDSPFREALMDAIKLAAIEVAEKGSGQ